MITHTGLIGHTSAFVKSTFFPGEPLCVPPLLILGHTWTWVTHDAEKWRGLYFEE